MLATLIRSYKNYKDIRHENRYLAPHDFQKLIEKYPFETVGFSVEKRPIKALKTGNGKIKIAIWTQMHGNESTATLAVLDLLNLLFLNRDFSAFISENVTLLIIPMLNPDGSYYYKRTNAQDIDINRDFLAHQAPETNLLMDLLESFSPDICFNMHDQRNIFNVSGTSNPATISFLAPSENFERTISLKRKQSMGVINAMYQAIEAVLPQHTGRYTDEFYPTAFGDNLQKKGYITVLFEAGAYPQDSNRAKARFLNWIALISGIYYIVNQKDNLDFEYEKYHEIPENDQKMLDIIYRNVKIIKNDYIAFVDIGIMLNESLDLDKKTLIANPKIAQIGDLRYYFAYEEIDANNKTFTSSNGCNYPILNDLANFKLINL